MQTLIKAASGKRIIPTKSQRVNENYKRGRQKGIKK
jgi:hypothetical protein